MAWQKTHIHEATPTETNLATRVYRADQYSQTPNAPCHDTTVPANTDFSAVYYSGYTQELLGGTDESRLDSLLTTLAAALANAAGQTNYSDPVDIQVYYSDAGGNPAHAPRAVGMARDWSFYTDQLLADMLPNGTDADDFIAILNTLRTESLVALGFQEV